MTQLRGSVAIVGGRIVTGTGDSIENGTVLITDGVITAVGRDVGVPDGVEVVDAVGRWVLPGFVDAHAHVGVAEEGEGRAGDDVNEMTDPNGARMRALDAINPTELGFSDALSGGVTTVVVKPGSGNPIGGQTVAVKTWGRIVDEMVVKSPTSVKSALGENPKRGTATRSSCRRPARAWPR
jgi:imidazolonepropionase-like amidohydrolase